jgi:hypothetical protein
MDGNKSLQHPSSQSELHSSLKLAQSKRALLQRILQNFFELPGVGRQCDAFFCGLVAPATKFIFGPFPRGLGG